MPEPQTHARVAGLENLGHVGAMLSTSGSSSKLCRPVRVRESACLPLTSEFQRVCASLSWLEQRLESRERRTDGSEDAVARDHGMRRRIIEPESTMPSWSNRNVYAR